ncbi:membrane-anchored junction protein isoform X3 [Takifugu rubripes]|uniref:membrane-anchored junction protein isoform X3 n=1 Tax=Takifugu rubripes TaxID=31033 RepID=UPI0011459D14|nr:membrane-anchored junction protein-like isoform X3 [Takifugu rubripes]
MASTRPGRLLYRDYAMQSQAPPAPSETRFFRGGNVIYKFEIRRNSGKIRKCFRQELRRIVRTVLGNLNSLQPFSSIHFNVFPYKRRWRGAAKVMCSQHESDLKVFPFVLIVCLEEKKASFSSTEDCDTSCSIKGGEEPEQSPPKRCRRGSPLEDAVLQELEKELEYESKVCVISEQHRSAPAGEEVQQSGGDVAEQNSGSSEVRPETEHSSRSEDESDEDGEDARPGPDAPARPGLLTRLASYIFPFSLFVKEP